MKQIGEDLKKLNNNGSSLVAVIIAMMLISILGAMTLAVGVIGYQMKIVEGQARDNMYGGESLLNQICSGLQEVSEDTLGKAHTYVLTRYSVTPENERAALVQEKYVDFMETLLKDKAGAVDVAAYDVSADGTTKTLKLTEAQRRSLLGWMNTLKADDTAGFIENKGMTNIVLKRGAGGALDDYSVTLTNITVGYENQGYETQITTDIKLSAPLVSLGEIPSSANMESLAGFGIIADKEMRSTSQNRIVGNVYAGEKLLAEPGAVLSVTSQQILSRGTLEAKGGGVLSIQGSAEENCEIWADNIRTTEDTQVAEDREPISQINIQGICNIANDLTMNNPIGNVNLWGEYYGYGLIEGVKSQTYGSSMAVNAPKARLNLSGLEKLNLSGRTSINVEATNTEGSVNTFKPVMQGESISYLWTQNAYLLPGDCLPGIGHNPMTLKEYETIFSNLVGADKFNLTRYIPLSLRRFLNPENPYTEVFVKHSIGETDTEIMVYLYMNFMTPNYASTFFQEYAQNLLQKKDMEDMATLLQFEGVNLNPQITDTEGSDERLRTAGNIVNYKSGTDLFSDPGAMSVSPGGVYSDPSLSNMAIGKTYMRNGLVSYLDGQRKISSPTSTLTENLINVDLLGEESTIEVAGNQMLWSGASDNLVLNGGRGLKSAGIVLNKGNVQVRQPFNGVIIADGDVIISADVTGLVMATGDIILRSGDIKADKQVFGTILNAGFDIQKYFKMDMGTGTPIKRKDVAPEKQGVDRIVISFENWKQG